MFYLKSLFMGIVVKHPENLLPVRVLPLF